MHNTTIPRQSQMQQIWSAKVMEEQALNPNLYLQISDRRPLKRLAPRCILGSLLDPAIKQSFKHRILRCAYVQRGETLESLLPPMLMPKST